MANGLFPQSNIERDKGSQQCELKVIDNQIRVAEIPTTTILQDEKPSEKDFTCRFGTLIKIREKLIEELKNEICCAIAYGSTFCEDFCTNSDFDILLFLKDDSISKLFKLRKIKENFQAEGVKIDFNVHSKTETPELRKECFWHNNRSLYFQKEVTLYGLVLIGESPFLHNDFNVEELKKESIKVVSSLLYQARKLLINRDINQGERITFMKWCIYAVLYALSSKGIVTKTKTEALELFPEYYSLDINPIIFLKAKKENNISDDLLEVAYKFLLQLDNKLFEDYKNGLK